MITFDSFGRYEKPVLTLANPNRVELGQLGSYMHLKSSLNFNAVSEIQFEYPYLCEDGKKSNLYDEIKGKRLIRTEELGYFIITNVEESNDGIKRYLSVTATSAEFELNAKKINLFNGTYKFYDPVDPSNTLLGKLFPPSSNWTIGKVSVDLWNKYRTFDISDSTLYGFLMNDVEESYEAIFVFDTYDRKVNAYSLSDAVNRTDIFISYRNLLKSESLEENTEEVVTCLSCYGGDGVSIAGVNPLGTAVIYNFDYFKPWMSDKLVAALNLWEKKIEDNTAGYKNLLGQFKEKNTSLISLQSELSDLQAQYDGHKKTQAIKIQTNRTEDDGYKSTVSSMKSLDSQISNKKNAIATIEAELSSLSSQLKAINDLLSFDNREIFSEENIAELENYRYESTYQDDTFITTDVMNLVERQEVAEQLFEQSEILLAKVSQPQYTISANSMNFVFLPEFQPLLDQLNQGGAEKLKQLLGATVNLETNTGKYIEAILLGIEFNYDDPTDFSMTFSNRYRLNDGTWEFQDLYGDTAKTSTNMGFTYEALKNWESYKGDVVSFVNSSLDLTKNALLNDSNNIEMEFDSTGLMGRRLNEETGKYYGDQVWLTNSVLAFTDDGFDTVKTALGKLTLADGSEQYGLIADVLIGKAIFGSQLTLSNEANNMTLDSAGLTITTTNGLNKVILSPSSGFAIQKKSGSSFVNQFFVDTSGNVEMVGKITATSGEIGGFKITKSSIESTDEKKQIQLNDNGTGKLGLLSWDATSATFSGNIYAKNLLDSIQTSNIATGAITTKKINDGAVTAAKLDTVYAEKTYVDELYADTATINDLNAAIAEFDDVYATQEYVNSSINNISTIGDLTVGVFRFKRDAGSMSLKPQLLYDSNGQLIKTANDVAVYILAQS